MSDLLEPKRSNSANSVTTAQALHVGPYRITQFGEDDFWIDHESGEGMQVFRVNFERLIDEFYKAEF